EKITVGLFNSGPDTWKKTRDKVVVHWYYMDGTEASWNDNLLPLEEDVPPFSKVETDVPDDLAGILLPDNDKKKKPKKGEKKTHKEMLVQPTVLRDVPVRVPFYFGPMYCVFDFQHEGINASTAAASKGNDILVIPVNVYSPTFTPLPVMAYYNVDGMSQDVDRGDGNIDGRGNSLPAEFLPPYVSRPSVGTSPAPSPLYPSGLWVKPLNDINTSRVCFLYPAKNNQTPNMMACQGQRLVFGAQERNAVHLLALSTVENVSGDFILSYADGTKETKKLTFTHWNDPPKHGERVAFCVPHRHTATGDDPTTRCYINHYSLPVERLKPLIGIEMPRLPAVKIIAVTLESAGVKP
ncbi:MAG: putative cellulase, partial [Armatimonadetes bacterium]|nr:putative cellulase [Armatimonadota bacterium]